MPSGRAARGLVGDAGLRLAVVGSRAFADPDAEEIAKLIIDRAMGRLSPAVVISGGAKNGVDYWAEEVAAAHGYTEANELLVIHRPTNQQWEPVGYKARNMAIGLDCTGMLCIRCHQALTHGSGWTATYTAKLGRPVRRVLL